MKESRLSLGLTERIVTALTLLVAILLLAASGWLWRWDQLIYDLQIDLWSSPPAEDIVIVAIDERSLADFGRWPWPRGIHAQLIDLLTEAGAKAIAVDILFAEEDLHGKAGDNQLIQSVAASGRVFLPVILEEQRLGGQLMETMPMPELASVAAGLGHMHMELDADGMARSIYLYEGLGQAYWPHMMLTLLNWLAPDEWPLQHKTQSVLQDTQSIKRHSHRFVPFTGPPGHYPRYSYSQILKGDYLPDAFTDRIVLVGVTATGLGDVLPTPVSAHGQPMPGVEINANILDVLRTDSMIESVGQMPYLIWTGVIVLIPFLLYPYVPPRLVPMVTVLLTLVLLACSLLLLHGMHLWFAPSAAMLGLLVSYPLWSWRRLELTVAYLKLELEKLNAEQQTLPTAQQPTELLPALNFLQQLMPLRGWVVYDNKGQLLHSDGELPESPYQPLLPGQWVRQGAGLWTIIRHQGADSRLGMSWPRMEFPRGRNLDLLRDFVGHFDLAPDDESSNTLELVERRIQQVQQANARLFRLRGFINVALGQMDDGLLVVNILGQIILANPRAAHYLGVATEKALVGQDAREVLQELTIRGEHTWNGVMQRLLLEGQPVRFEAHRAENLELYCQLQPLDDETAGMFGMIVNLSDIGVLKQAERTRARMLNFLSHDMRSPITSLLSLTQSKQSMEGTAQQLAERIQPLAQRSLRMADDFLQYARAEVVDTTTFTDTDFVSVIYNAMGDVYAQAQSRHIQLLRQFTLEEVWLQGNVALLERALLNLLDNAIKFSPDGGTVSLHLTRHDGLLECCVQDQGPGIAADVAESIFQPYQQGQQSRAQRTGVGLGLSFVKLVAEKHNGRIELRNPTEGGAMFCLVLPCEAEGKEDAAV